ncbi:MAG: hypothetical protein MZV64_18270 [Ignavibacteriales bacterium]|nr:hypothetical protein [Ignavibacteriales bacterium]
MTWPRPSSRAVGRLPGCGHRRGHGRGRHGRRHAPGHLRRRQGRGRPVRGHPLRQRQRLPQVLRHPQEPPAGHRPPGRGRARPIDLMEVEGRVAAFASIGATARVTGEKLRGKVQGLWGHLLAGRRLFDTPAEEKILELYGRPRPVRTVRAQDGHARTSSTASSPRRTTSATAGGSLPRPSSTTAISTSPCSRSARSSTPSSSPCIYLGFYQRRLRHFKARRVVISGEDLPIQFNGEFLGDRDRVEFGVLPKAIRMVVPPTRRAAKRFRAT